MKFAVTGSSRENGARMTLELEADSKAAAEKKASSAGMMVHKVQPQGGEASLVTQRPTQYRSGSGGKLLLLLIMAAVAIAAWYYRGRFLHR